MSFVKSMRGGVSALGLGLIAGLGMAVGAVAFAPAAVAQNAPKVSKEFGVPATDAQKALGAKDFATASAKIDAASPHAKSAYEKLMLERLRFALAVGKNDKVAMIKSTEALNTMGIPAEELKQNKARLAGWYLDTGNKAKATQLTKEYVDQYGGTADQYAYLASSALGAKNWQEAISYGQKAMDAKRKAGAKPDEKWHNIVMKAYFESKNMDGYYAALEKAAADYPNRPEYWRDLLMRATREPKFNRTASMLDIYRAMAAADVPLKNEEKKEMAELALSRGMNAEGLAVMQALVDSGAVGGANDPAADRNKRMLDTLKKSTAADKAGGLDKEANDPSAKGETLAAIGEAWIGQGDAAKAVDVIQKGIAKGGMDDNTLAIAKLHLGYAQYKAGQKDAARKTWGEVKSDNGAEVLARTWISISRS